MQDGKEGNGKYTRDCVTIHQFEWIQFRPARAQVWTSPEGQWEHLSASRLVAGAMGSAYNFFFWCDKSDNGAGEGKTSLKH